MMMMMERKKTHCWGSPDYCLLICLINFIDSVCAILLSSDPNSRYRGLKDTCRTIGCLTRLPTLFPKSGVGSLAACRFNLISCKA